MTDSTQEPCIMRCVLSTMESVPTDSIMDNLTVGTEAMRRYSPITMNLDWPRLTRLLIIVFVSTYGTILNTYFVSAFFVDSSLRHLGNAYLSCTGVFDLIITIGIAPVAAVVIVSGQWDSVYLCKGLYFLGLTASYGYLFYFMFVSMETYYSSCLPKSKYPARISIQSSFGCIFVAVMSVALAASGAFLGFDYDYCSREHTGKLSYRIATTVVLQIIPAGITIFYLTNAFNEVKRRGKQNIQYRRSKSFEREYASGAMNLVAYILHLLSWLPYSIIVYLFPYTSDEVFYNFVALGLLRSVITSTLYGLFHMNFRRAYGQIFKYCCCKNELNERERPIRRHRRHAVAGRKFPNVKVHILHEVVAKTPRRPRFSNQRDVAV